MSGEPRAESQSKGDKQMATEAYHKLSRVSFSDGRPIAVAWDGWTLLLDYRNWQEEILRFKFRGVAFVSGYGSGASLCEGAVSCESPEIEHAKSRLANDWGSKETWKDAELTQLVISDDVPVLTVVFKDVEIQRLTGESDTINAKFADFDHPET